MAGRCALPWPRRGAEVTAALTEKILKIPLDYPLMGPLLRLLCDVANGRDYCLWKADLVSGSWDTKEDGGNRPMGISWWEAARALVGGKLKEEEVGVRAGCHACSYVYGIDRWGYLSFRMCTSYTYTYESTNDILTQRWLWLLFFSYYITIISQLSLKKW